MRIRCRGDLFTEPLPSNDNLVWLHYFGFQATYYIQMLLDSVFCVRSLSCIYYTYMCCERKVGDLFFPELLVPHSCAGGETESTW
jgi:hypothetical protein